MLGPGNTSLLGEMKWNLDTSHLLVLSNFHFNTNTGVATQYILQSVVFFNSISNLRWTHSTHWFLTRLSILDEVGCGYATQFASFCHCLYRYDRPECFNFRSIWIWITFCYASLHGITWFGKQCCTFWWFWLRVSWSSLHVGLATTQTPAFYTPILPVCCLGYTVNLSTKTALKRKLNRTLGD